jgi:uncharacterized membrane protein
MRAGPALAVAAWLFAGCEAPDAEPPAEPTLALDGAQYLPARSITQTYCGPCHTRGGQDPERERAYKGYKLDTYDQMKARMVLLQNAITVHGTRADMPPIRAKLQPTDAERQVLLDWVELGAPNTPSGR